MHSCSSADSPPLPHKKIPFARIFELFDTLKAQHVIIEFVSKGDPMVRQLLANREMCILGIPNPVREGCGGVVFHR